MRLSEIVRIRNEIGACVTDPQRVVRFAEEFLQAEVVIRSAVTELGRVVVALVVYVIAHGVRRVGVLTALVGVRWQLEFEGREDWRKCGRCSHRYRQADLRRFGSRTNLIVTEIFS